MKDELVKAEWPNTLVEFAEGVIKIDLRNYTRRLEKVQKGKAPIKPNTPAKRKEKTITERGNAIDLDRVQTQKNHERGKRWPNNKKNPQRI